MKSIKSLVLLAILREYFAFSGLPGRRSSFNLLKDSSRDISILEDASISRNIDKDSVCNLILNYENCSKSNQAKIEDLKGKWELIFSSLIPKGYFPVTEVCDFFEYRFV